MNTTPTTGGDRMNLENLRAELAAALAEKPGPLGTRPHAERADWEPADR